MSKVFCIYFTLELTQYCWKNSLSFKILMLVNNAYGSLWALEDLNQSHFLSPQHDITNLASGLGGECHIQGLWFNEKCDKLIKAWIQSHWELWWTHWHWDRFCSRNASGFACHYSANGPYSFICHWCQMIIAVGNIIKQHTSKAQLWKLDMIEWWLKALGRAFTIWDAILITADTWTRVSIACINRL